MKRILGILIVISLISIVTIMSLEKPPKSDLNLTGAKVIMLIGEGYNEQEAGSTIKYLVERGAEVIIVGTDLISVTSYDNTGISRRIEKLVNEINIEEIDAIVVPGGQSAYQLSKNQDVLVFVRTAYLEGKLCAAICSGPSVFIEAGILAGKSATAQFGLKEDLTRSGAMWLNSKVVVDENLVTSRMPSDLRYFNKEIGIMLEKLLENRES